MIVDGAVRLLLGLAIAAGLGLGVWTILDGGLRGGAFAGCVSVATIFAWLRISALGDPAITWPAPVAIPRIARLGAEVAALSLAATVIWMGGSRAAAETLLTVAGLHYALTWERVAWLLDLRQSPGAHRSDAGDRAG